MEKTVKGIILIDVKKGVIGLDYDSSRTLDLNANAYKVSPKYSTLRWIDPFWMLKDQEKYQWSTYDGAMGNLCFVGAIGYISSFEMTTGINISKVGKVLEYKNKLYNVRHCNADRIVGYLIQRENRKKENNRESFWWIRRECFNFKNLPKPKSFYFSKGTVSVSVPDNAVAVMGQSEADWVVFLNKFGLVISAWKSKQDGPYSWAEKISMEPDRYKGGREKDRHRPLRPIGARSSTLAIFGKHS